VEGYFDCIAMHHNGFAETVATLGTALSEHHAKELARRVPKVVVCFDGDAAGREAAKSALRVLLSANLQVFVSLLPMGQDPDEIVRQEGASAFANRLAAALGPAEFLFEFVERTPSNRRGALLDALEVANSCPDPVRAFEMREALARMASVRLEQLQLPHSGLRVTQPIQETELPPFGELALLRSLLIDVRAERRGELLALVPVEAVDHPATRAILEAMLKRAARGETLEISALTADIEDSDVRRVVAALEHEVPETDEERLTLVILRELCDKNRKTRLADLSLEIARAEKQGNKEKLAQLQREKNALIRRPKSTT
jgi:DNA primase